MFFPRLNPISTVVQGVVDSKSVFVEYLVSHATQKYRNTSSS